MESYWKDIRHTIRGLLRSPGVFAIAVLTLSLGIGANTAIFSLVNSILFRPLPVKDPAQIVLVAFTRDHGSLSETTSYPVLEDLQKQADSPFSDLVGFQYGSDGLNVDGKSNAVFTNYVTGNYFEALGIRPVQGRLFLPSEGKVPGADPIVVLSYSYWQTKFGSDPNLVGRKILVDGHPFTIVGVTPEGFHGLAPMLDIRAYIPFAMRVSFNAELGSDPTRNPLSDRKIRALHLYARLKPGVSAKQAAIALAMPAKQIALLAPDVDKDLEISVFPELQARPDPQSFKDVWAVSGIFLGLAAFVLILACMNVVNILLVRANLRRREMAIRAALGGTRARLIRLLLTESIALAIFGGLGGVLLGQWLSGLVSTINLGTALPLVLEFSFDWCVFSYGFAAALVTGALVGIVPALRASRNNLTELMRESSRSIASGRQRFRSALVIAQVAGSLMLLIMAGLFARSMEKARKVNLGFDPTHVANFSFDTRGIGYNEAQGLQLSKTILDRVRVMPGVESASIASTVPFGYYQNTETVEIDGYKPPSGSSKPVVLTSAVYPGYFSVMKMPLDRGRDFNEGDTAASAPVVIINEAMAKKFWPNQDPIGRQLRIQSHPKMQPRVIGVVRDSRFEDFSGPIGPFFYSAMTQAYMPLQTLHIRTSGSPETIIPTVQAEIEKLATGLPLFDVGTMSGALNTLNGLLLFQLAAGIAAALGLLGLILAVVGVYGIVSYVTSQRTNEIGIRIALGARPAQILMMVLRQGLIVVVIGLALGLAAAFAAGQLAASLLVGISPTDPVTYGVVSLVLASIALVSCYIPARRATKVDPMTALRYE